MTLKAPEITEFLADNRKGLAYDDGDASGGKKSSGQQECKDESKSKQD
jgi:hypothetical protein